MNPVVQCEPADSTGPQVLWGSAVDTGCVGFLIGSLATLQCFSLWCVSQVLALQDWLSRELLVQVWDAVPCAVVRLGALLQELTPLG